MIRRAANKLLSRPELLQSLLVLVVLFVVAVLVSPGLRKPMADDFGLFTVTWPAGWPLILTSSNLTDLLRSNAIVGVMALGMTLVILTAGIDLSVGSILFLASAVTAKLLMHVELINLPLIHAYPPWQVAAAGGVLAGTCIGLINGGLIAWLRIQPFIITLAMMIGVRGLGKTLTNNQLIGVTGVDGSIPVLFTSFVSSKIVIIGSFVLFAILFALLLWGTVLGRYIRAIGDNAKAADYAGLPSRRVLITVYTLMGLLSGIAGVLVCARTGGASNDQGIAIELDVIAVVVIGGTSLAGGRGSILGTVIGVLIIALLKNVLGVNGVDQNQQDMIMASVIIAAVAAQMFRGSALPSWLKPRPSQPPKP